MSSPKNIVIVGAGLTAGRAAETLRKEGFDGRLVMVGDEPAPPYERPPLSKEFLRGETEQQKFQVHEDGYYASHDIDFRPNTAATALDLTGRTVTLADGEQLPWDRLLLATGAEPRRPPIPGADLDGVVTLRTLADSARLRETIQAGGRLVVIGAGWIGAEAAAGARALGGDVTVLEMLSVPLELVLGREIGAMYGDLHREHGVDLRTGVKVEALEGSGRVERVRLGDGTLIDCSAVLMATGVRPRTELAEAAGLAVDNGILVNSLLETDTPGVFAAGDVANAEHPFYGRRVRVEHWSNARHQGPAAAMSMLGKGQPYTRLPYFYSDQYDVGMEYSGLPSGGERLVIRGDLAKREFIAFWLDGARVVAGMNVNVWGDNETIQELIRSRVNVDQARLLDPASPLKDLLPAGA